MSTKQGSIFPETFTVFIEPACFPNVSQFCHMRNIVSSINFCFQGVNYASATQQRIRACEQLQTFCENEQASTHLIFARNWSKGKILQALSNWMGPYYIPNTGVQMPVARISASFWPLRLLYLGKILERFQDQEILQVCTCTELLWCEVPLTWR